MLAAGVSSSGWMGSWTAMAEQSAGLQESSAAKQEDRAEIQQGRLPDWWPEETDFTEWHLLPEETGFAQWSILLPARWNSAENGRKPVVKSQGSYGTCWALAATSALEAAILPDERIVFSADHLAWNNAFSVPIDAGGDYLMTMAYLSGWQGPVLEEEDPYGDGVSPEGLLPAVHVQEMQLLDGASEEEIKAAVLEYGAVQTSLYMSRETVSEKRAYYNPVVAAYYDTRKREQNHDIIVLGWDDTYSRFLFRQVPARDGAWICQNTWGEEFGIDGIFYVSYEDANLLRTSIAYTRVEDTDNYADLYQTDDCGWQGTQGYGDADCWFANEYTARGEEALAALGFYATGPDTSYDLYFLRGSIGSDAVPEYLLSGECPYAGYYTVDLDQTVELAAGEVFTVMVCIHTPGTGNPVAVEYRADAYTQKVVTEGKYGYISRDGESWTHTEEEYGTNVCLKAYVVR